MTETHSCDDCRHGFNNTNNSNIDKTLYRLESKYPDLFSESIRPECCCSKSISKNQYTGKWLNAFNNPHKTNQCSYWKEFGIN